MTYSCSDLADDCLNAAVETGLVKMPPGDDEIDPSDQADLIMECIGRAARDRKTLLAVAKAAEALAVKAQRDGVTMDDTGEFLDLVRPALAVAKYGPPRAPIALASGRVVAFTRMPNGSQDAIPTTGPREMTEAEHADMVAQIKATA